MRRCCRAKRDAERANDLEARPDEISEDPYGRSRGTAVAQSRVSTDVRSGHGGDDTASQHTLPNGDKAFDGFRTAIRSVEIPARAMGGGSVVRGDRVVCLARPIFSLAEGSTVQG